MAGCACLQGRFAHHRFQLLILNELTAITPKHQPKKRRPSLIISYVETSSTAVAFRQHSAGMTSPRFGHRFEPRTSLVSMCTLTMSRTYLHREPSTAAIAGSGPPPQPNRPKTTAIRLPINRTYFPRSENDSPSLSPFCSYRLTGHGREEPSQLLLIIRPQRLTGHTFPRRRPLDPSP